MIFQDPYSSLNPLKSIRATLEEPLRIHRIGDLPDESVVGPETLASHTAGIERIEHGHAPTRPLIGCGV